MNGIKVFNDTMTRVYTSPMNLGSHELDHMLIRWEQTKVRTCPVLGTPVTFEQVMAGQYALPRINGDSENGYEVCPEDEYLHDIATLITRWVNRDI